MKQLAQQQDEGAHKLAVEEFCDAVREDHLPITYMLEHQRLELQRLLAPEDENGSTDDEAKRSQETNGEG